VFISQILRAFRKNIKQRYERVYGKTSDRRWSEERMRKKAERKAAMEARKKNKANKNKKDDSKDKN